MAALFIADKAYLQGPLRRPGGNELPKGKAFEKSWRKLQWKPGRVSTESLFKPGGCQIGALPRWLRSKESACQCRRCGFNLWVGKEDPLEKEMATHFSIPAWENRWTEEPGRL